MSLDVLQTLIRNKKCPIAVSLDLRADVLPPDILARADSLDKALEEFGCGVLEALRDVLPAVKFQTAYYEALGPAGLTLLARLCAHARETGYYVILETLRCDPEPVSELLAPVYLTQAGPYQADAVSLCGFAGTDSIRPYLPHCAAGKSVFILAKTPNKSSREVQDLISGDRVIYTVMADLAMRWGGDLIGKSGYSQIGISVGATHPAVLAQLRAKYDRLFFLVPGYGEQGAKDVRGAFDQFGHGALLTVGDPVLAAWKQNTDADYHDLVREAAQKLRAELSAQVTVM